jgi:hypothetical protein
MFEVSEHLPDLSGEWLDGFPNVGDARVPRFGVVLFTSEGKVS